jgi:hypothetical protein
LYSTGKGREIRKLKGKEIGLNSMGKKERMLT